jgi:hypothetical protein
MKTTLVLLFYIIAVFACRHKENPEEKKSDSLEIKKENSGTDENEHNCSYYNKTYNLGIGLIKAPTTFEIFNDSLLTERMLKINVYEDEDHINFCSVFHKPDYGIMHFICIEENENFYKVLIGFSDQKFLPKREDYQFKSWKDYILESFGIRRALEFKETTFLKREPLDNSQTITIPDGHELFCPVEVKGDWVKVKYDCFYNTTNNPYEGQLCHEYIDTCEKEMIGWLKWRNENEILIDIFLLP